MSFKTWLSEADEPIATDEIVDIYFNNLDEVTQKKVIEGLMKTLNVTANDEFGNKKIIDGLSKTPLVSLTIREIPQKIKFDL